MSAPGTPAPLRALGPAWFTLVMGIAGLALAWTRAVPLMGEGALGAALVLGALAIALFLLLGVLSLWRWLRHPGAVKSDALHPARRVFFATVPLALTLVASLVAVLLRPGALAVSLWAIASLAQIAVTVWVFLKLRPGASQPFDWALVTPALLIPGVGNVVPAIAGPALGYPVLSALQLALGAALWLFTLALLGLRLRRKGRWPLPQLPLTFILVAPPSVIGLALLQLGAPAGAAIAMWVVALLFTAASLAVVKRMTQQAFALPFWALVFPLAAFTSLSLELAPLVGGPAAPACMLLLAVVSLLTLGFAGATLNGLRRGELLRPDPMPVPAGVLAQR